MLTKEQLGQLLNLPTRTIDTLRQKKLIPCFKYGHRTVRYELKAVEKAVESLEIKEIGRN